jgi:glycosyltransferase involved in cell wall biosynthesis
MVTRNITVRGGAENKILRLADHFGARIHCVEYEPEKTFEGFGKIHIETAPRRKKSGNIIMRMFQDSRYFHNLELDDYDLVIAHMPPSEFIRRRNSPVLWHCYSPNRLFFDLYERNKKKMGVLNRMQIGLAGAVYKRAENRVVPKIECILTNSANSQQRIRRFLNRESEIVYSGIDSGRFRCRSFENFFFYPSRIAPEKDFEFAIDAFKAFRRRAGGDWKMVIAGSSADDSPYLSRLRELAGENISIEANISDERLNDLYSRCYAVLYSPMDEDFGNIPLEAMASSKPCIARNEGGPKETIIDGKDGFLVNNSQEMAERMGILARDPELCERMGKEGRRKVLGKYSWEYFLKRFEEKAKEVVEATTHHKGPDRNR